MSLLSLLDIIAVIVCNCVYSNSDKFQKASFFFSVWPSVHTKSAFWITENGDVKWPCDLCHSPLLTTVCACSTIHLAPRQIFKFTRISLDGKIIENDTKTIVWTESILYVFREKTLFSNLSG